MEQGQTTSDDSGSHRYDLVALGSQDGIWELDLETGELYVSVRWLEVSGSEGSRTTLDDWIDLVHPDDRPLVNEAAAAHLSRNSDHLEVEVRVDQSAGETRWILIRGIADAHDPPRKLAGSITDTTDAHSSAAGVSQSFHDPLTGLPNRTLLMEELNRHHAREQRDPTAGVAVLFLDLVGFKQINDTYGHDVGDQVLRVIGRRLRVATRPEDLPTRFGGDEFVVVMADFTSIDPARQVADRLLGLLRQPIPVDDHELEITPSAGLVVASDGRWSPEALIREADTAMYRAKRRGSGRIESLLMPTGASDASTPAAESLAAAPAEGRLLLHYQPMVTIAGGEVHAYEALLHWRRPGRGSVAAYSGEVEIGPQLDGMLSEWTLFHALEEAAAAMAAGAQIPRLAVNVSRMVLIGSHFHRDLEVLLDAHGVAPARLRLEVTEATLDGLDVKLLEPIRRLGVGIHLDGFGSGPTSLRLLHDLAPDAVKIDGRLTAAALDDVATQRMIRSVCASCETVGIPVIADAVEVPATADLLTSTGCTLAQGALYAAPLPAGRAFTDRAFTAMGAAVSSVSSSLLGDRVSRAPD